MLKVFVSSVVSGFEPIRVAARKVIENLGHSPVMCELFSAKPYSSEKACITEVEHSDVYVVILGSRYGYKTPSGFSVTQEEFRAAKNLGKPILAFVQDTLMEADQLQFKSEVEDYVQGVFRATFSNESDFKDVLLAALAQLDRRHSASPKSEFESLLSEAENELSRFSSRDAAKLTLGLWAQPAREVDLDVHKDQLDAHFMQMASNKLLSLKDGYTPILAKTWVGLKSNESRHSTTLGFFENGLVIVQIDPTVEREGHHFDSYYVQPSRLREIIIGASKLFSANGGWCSLELRGMQYKSVSELPSHSNSMSMVMRSDEENRFRDCTIQIPYVREAYVAWSEAVIKKLVRRYSSKS